MRGAATSVANAEFARGQALAQESWPTWFGRDRPLFGWWHLPIGREARATVVMAPGLARERLAADYSWRLLASSLADAGFAVLRFDFTGTGDSAGDARDPDLVQRWHEDVQTAVASARSASSAPVILLGHRVGAMLAALAVRDGLMVDALVLWDPVAGGRRYLREMAAQQTMAVNAEASQSPRPGPGWADVPGDSLSTQTADALSALTLSIEQPVPVAALLVLARPGSPAFTKAADPQSVRYVVGLEEMLNLNPLEARTAEEPIAETLAWLDATVDRKAYPVDPPAQSTTTMRHAGQALVETAQQWASGMFGVVTEPAGAAAPTETVVMLSASVEAHTGPGRLWVELARDWAASGVRAVRCDLPGLGESAPGPGFTRQTVYAPTAIDDLESLVRAISPHDPGAVSLAGMCSGAYTALEVAWRLRSRRLFLFAFGWWLVPAELTAGKRVDPGRRAYLSALWLLRPVLLTKFGRRLMTEHPIGAWLTGSSMRLVRPLRPFRQLIKAGTEVTLYMGEADTAYFTTQPRAFERLKRRPQFRYHSIAGLDHALLNGEPRRAAGELIRSALVRSAARPPETDGEEMPSNEKVFAEERSRDQLDAEGWCDPGERAASLRIADRVRGGRILDVGIGTGRTTTLLRLLSNDYVGIDYVPEMVDAARERHPGVDLHHGDARDLSAFGDGEFDLISFSYNGIDAVGHEDRQRVLKEFHRALRPGGCLMYSTLNADGPAPTERPWRLNPQTTWQLGSLKPSGSSLLRRTLRIMVRLARSPADPLRELVNWFRVQRRSTKGPDWHEGPMSAHQFGLLIHFTTLAGIRREMAEHGFKVDCIIGSDRGEILPEESNTSDDWWYHVIATPIVA